MVTLFAGPWRRPRWRVGACLLALAVSGGADGQRAPSAAPQANWAAAAAVQYDRQPDVAGCAAGSLKASARSEMLSRVNALRALHYLPPVTYSAADDAQAERAALMMAANRELSHAPTARWPCYHSTGAAGAATSNLVLGYGPSLAWSNEDALLRFWMTERGSADIGHRRWLLDPFLGKVAFARVTQQLPGGSRTDAASLKVFGFNSAPAVPPLMPVFIAYPYGDYPLRYFGPSDYLSFSVVANAGSRTANAGVSFAGASVTISHAGGHLPVTHVGRDNDPYGLPNSLQWRVTGLQPGITYTVRINGVNGAPKSSYHYSFRMVP